MKIKLSLLYSLSFLELLVISCVCNVQGMSAQHTHIPTGDSNSEYVVDRLLAKNLNASEIMRVGYNHLLSVKDSTRSWDAISALEPHFHYIVRMLATIASKNPEILVQQYFGKYIEGTFAEEFCKVKYDDLHSDGAKLGYKFVKMLMNLKVDEIAIIFKQSNENLLSSVHEEVPQFIADYKIFDFFKKLGVVGSEKQMSQNMGQGNPLNVSVTPEQSKSEENYKPLVSFENAINGVKNSIKNNKSHIINTHFDFKDASKFQLGKSNGDCEDILFNAFGSNLVASNYYWNKIPEMIVAVKNADYYKSEQLEKLIGIPATEKTDNLYKDLANIKLNDNLFSIVNYFALLCIINNKFDTNSKGVGQKNEVETFIKNHNKFIESGFLKRTDTGGITKIELTPDGATIINLTNFIIKNFQAKTLLDCFKNRKSYKEKQSSESEATVTYENKPTLANFEGSKTNNAAKSLLSIYYTPALRSKISGSKDAKCQAVTELFKKLDDGGKDIEISNTVKTIGFDDVKYVSVEKILQELGLNQHVTALDTKNEIKDIDSYIDDVCYNDTILINFTGSGNKNINGIEKIKDKFDAINIVAGANFYMLSGGKLQKSEPNKKFVEYKDNSVKNISYVLLTKKRKTAEVVKKEYIANIDDVYRIIEDIKGFATKGEQEAEIQERVAELTKEFNLQSLADVINNMIYIDELINQKHEGLKWLVKYLKGKKQKFSDNSLEKLDKLTNKLFDILEEVSAIIDKADQTQENAKDEIKKNVIGKYTQYVVENALESIVNIEKVITNNAKNMWQLLNALGYLALHKTGKNEEHLRKHLDNSGTYTLKSSDKPIQPKMTGVSGQKEGSFIDELNNKNTRNITNNGSSQSEQTSSKKQVQASQAVCDLFFHRAKSQLGNSAPQGGGKFKSQSSKKHQDIGGLPPPPAPGAVGLSPPPPPPAPALPPSQSHFSGNVQQLNAQPKKTEDTGQHVNAAKGNEDTVKAAIRRGLNERRHLVNPNSDDSEESESSDGSV